MTANRFNELKGNIVRHFKGGYYYVYNIVKHTETGEPMVLYYSIDIDTVNMSELNNILDKSTGLYVRPFDMFMSEVDREKYPDIKQQYRFELYKKNIKKIN